MGTEDTDTTLALFPEAAAGGHSSDFERELAAHLKTRLRIAFTALAVVVTVMWVVPQALHFFFAGSFRPIGAFQILHLVSIAAILQLIFALRGEGWTYRRILRTDAVAFLIGIGVTLALAALSAHDIFPFVFCVLILLVIVRAVVVPSSGKRTLWLSLLAVPGLVVVFVVNPRLPMGADSLEEPGFRQAFIGLYVVVLLLGIGVAALASRVAFSLRRQAFEAKRLGQYELEERIGGGTMGEVFRATHALLKRPTAVKLLKPEITGPDAIRRFEREVRQTSRLTHPNTISIFDYGHTAQGVFYYAMELLDGLDLKEIVRRTGPMPPARVIHILLQVSGSLAEAHELGLIHRDIKPGNIVLCERGGIPDVVKVLDFGLVKELRSDDPALTQAGLFVGTPETAAPETFYGKTSRASDLYSFGAVAFFLLTGEPPFSCRDIGELVRRHMQESAPPPSSVRSDVPEDLDRIVSRCLAREPEDRPGSAGELRRELEGCAAAGRWSEDDARAWWRALGEVGPP
jgi:serine/threonine-protein kinase